MVLKKRRRRALLDQRLPPELVAILEQNVPYYQLLPEPMKCELEGTIHVFLDEKNFEGCADLEITDEMRLTIAGYACILLLGRETEFYPLLASILVYPDSYVAPMIHVFIFNI